jgi:predicted CXXCH cytochrome family protein
MSRARLIAGFALVGALMACPAAAAGGMNPHLDSSLIRRGCPVCHAAHGRSRSPMMHSPQSATCMGCHGSVMTALRQELPASARPASLDRLDGKVAVHPIDRDAFSRRDPNVVVCTSCHSPHRSIPQIRPPKPDGTRYRASVDPSKFENDVCLGCHRAQSRVDIASRVRSVNRSYHPLTAPAAGQSRSLDLSLTGKLINCTDCHGNSDPSGPRGPHASDVAGLLAREYRRGWQADESDNAFALCYACHDRSAVLGSSSFPQHELHVVKKRIACDNCHDPHGDVENRALVSLARMGGTPSLRSGRMVFESDAPGSGSCHLNCHGVDHGPASYGAADATNRLRPFFPPDPATPAFGPPSFPEKGHRSEPKPERIRVIDRP